MIAVGYIRIEAHYVVELWQNGKRINIALQSASSERHAHALATLVVQRIRHIGGTAEYIGDLSKRTIEQLRYIDPHGLDLRLAEKPDFRICFPGVDESFMKTMSNTGKIIFWATGPDSECKYLSEAWFKHTGRTPKQELGKGWVLSIHPDDRSNVSSIYNKAFIKRKPFVVDYRLRRADGKYAWIHGHGAPQFTPAGEFLGFVGSAIEMADAIQAAPVTR